MNNSEKSLCKSNIKKNNYNEAKQIVKNLNLSAETANLIAPLISNKNISNLPELNFVVNMLSNLKKKLGYTRNQKRKSELESLIKKLDELKNQMINGNQINKNKLKGILDEIEKFYLGTRRKKNSTRDYFYQQLNLLYKCQENNEGKFAKQLRKLLLNKKLSYSNIGQIFSPRSKNRKGKIINFLQKNNVEILGMINNNNSEIQKFYNNSKKNNNKELYKKFKENYKEFSRKEGEKSQAELEKKAKQAQVPQQVQQQVQQQLQQQQKEEVEEEYSLQSKKENNEEKKINELISALNAFIESAKIKGITLQGLTSNKKKVRKELRYKLKEQVELLQKYKNGNYKQNETLDKIIKNIQELFKNYNTKKGSTWTNGTKTTNKRKKVENLLTHNPSTTVVGGSMYINIKGVGKRKLRYYNNGKKYVLVKGKKVSI